MLAVAGGKGGSGKTTTTVGLARALARRGASVVAADADWDLPNLTTAASETAGRVATSTRQTTGTRAAVNERTHSPSAPTQNAPSVLDVLTAGEFAPAEHPSPTILDAPDPGTDVDLTHTFETLETLVAPSSPLLVDCPAGVSPDAAAPLRVADGCVLVTPLRRAALYDTAKTAAFARRLDCPPVGTIVVRADAVPGAGGSRFGCPVLGAVPWRPPTPVSTRSVQSAYDVVARRLCAAYGGDRWRVA